MYKLVSKKTNYVMAQGKNIDALFDSATKSHKLHYRGGNKFTVLPTDSCENDNYYCIDGDEDAIKAVIDEYFTDKDKNANNPNLVKLFAFAVFIALGIWVGINLIPTIGSNTTPSKPSNNIQKSQ